VITEASQLARVRVPFMQDKGTNDYIKLFMALPFLPDDIFRLSSLTSYHIIICSLGNIMVSLIHTREKRHSHFFYNKYNLHLI
jgi:hypothetical protein